MANKTRYLWCSWVVPNNSKHSEASFFCWFQWIRCACKCLDIEIWRFSCRRQTTDKTDYFTPCTCARGNYCQELLFYYGNKLSCDNENTIWPLIIILYSCINFSLDRSLCSPKFYKALPSVILTIGGAIGAAAGAAFGLIVGGSVYGADRSCAGRCFGAGISVPTTIGTAIGVISAILIYRFCCRLQHKPDNKFCVTC